jgi:D-alanyl-D-alanine carboxypeptidase
MPAERMLTSMRLPRSLILAAALVAPAAAFGAACGDSDPAEPAAAEQPTPVPTTRTTLDAQLREVVDAGSPGVIALVNDGHGVELHAAGVADTETGRALRPTDRFRAGSNTKTFVSTVALQLVAEGKLSLDDTLERWVPGILPNGDEVNLRQLLNMTAGVPDYVPGLMVTMLGDPEKLSRPYSPRELIAMVAGKRPESAPGGAFHYSSTNTILAGLIIERATGHSIRHEVEQRIFEPVGMRHTTYPGATSAIRGAHSRGYGLADGHLLDVTAFNASAGGAAGGAISTASDMARFWRALLGGKLLDPAQLAAMKTTVPIGGNYPGSYGLGLMKFGTECGTMWGNGGDLPGFSSEFFNSEDGKVQAGVIVNVNPIPKAVSGEPLGVAKRTAIQDALHRDRC